MKNVEEKVKKFFKISKETSKILENLYYSLRNIDYLTYFGYGADIELKKETKNYSK